MRFNSAPGWPRPATGWVPPPGWQSDPSWPPAPRDLLLWVQDDADPHSGSSSGDHTSITSPASAEPSSPSSPSAMLIAGIGGSVSLFSFLALPYFSISPRGGINMPTAISFLSRFEPKFSLLWLVPAVALYIVEAYFLLRTSTMVGRLTRIRLTVFARNLSLLGCIGYVALIVLPSQIANHPTASESIVANLSLLRIGYFIGFLGMFAALIGSMVEAWELKPQKHLKN